MSESISFKKDLGVQASFAVERANDIYYDKAPLYPDSGSETVQYTSGTSDDLLRVAARCLYEVVMRIREER